MAGGTAWDETPAAVTGESAAGAADTADGNLDPDDHQAPEQSDPFRADRDEADGAALALAAVAP